MPKKRIETFEEHWRTRHRRALDAAHERLLAPLCDSSEIGLSQDDLFSAAEAYEKAMGIKIADDDEERDMTFRWTDVFRKAWRREVRRNGTAFVPCEAFDVAMRAALLAVGEFWPGMPQKTAKQAQLQRAA
jgi:hypothetical protein